MHTPDKPRRAGRKARVTARAAPPVINPAPPGQIGGAYRPLTDTDLKAIFATALRLLAELGMGEVPDRLWADLTVAGAVDLGNARLISEPVARRSIRLILIAGFTAPRPCKTCTILRAFRIRLITWRGSRVAALPRMCPTISIWTSTLPMP